MDHPSHAMEFANILHHLNYRWSAEALALSKGDKAPFELYQIYEPYKDFISLETLAQIDRLRDDAVKIRLKHSFIDHYLRQRLLPHETEMQCWMKGASAAVNGEKVYFNEIIPWCQKSSTYKKRQILHKETVPLCKFLMPFVLNYWNMLLEILEKDLGFDSYIQYCQHKKGIDYAYYYRYFKKVLQETDKIYFSAMKRWSRERYGLSMSALTRFDAINLLGFGEFDNFFPDIPMNDLMRFFHHWNIDLDKTPGLNLELGRESGKSAQAACFILQVPEEVYILMRPEGGWIDIETLWHELGHGLSAVFTCPDLTIVDRDMATNYSLSESFAFLLQNLTLSRPFIDEYLGLGPEVCNTLVYHKVLKDLSVFRRYAAKLLSEFEMFSKGDLSDGDRYSRLMTRYTGFYYQAETHLFDLVPEFYCLDYLLGWMGESMLEDYLRKNLGDRWMFDCEKILETGGCSNPKPATF
ncbi:MAG: hypothetical protein JRE10_13040 [Deltaproteobacteria bacterium]|nr:hypothetical protein [Deltaproteobacteria bacterium]